MECEVRLCHTGVTHLYRGISSGYWLSTYTYATGMSVNEANQMSDILQLQLLFYKWEGEIYNTT